MPSGCIIRLLGRDIYLLHTTSDPDTNLETSLSRVVTGRMDNFDV